MLDYFVKQQKHSAFPQPSQDAHRRNQNLPQTPNQKTSVKQTHPFFATQRVVVLSENNFRMLEGL